MWNEITIFYRNLVYCVRYKIIIRERSCVENKIYEIHDYNKKDAFISLSCSLLQLHRIYLSRVTRAVIESRWTLARERTWKKCSPIVISRGRWRKTEDFPPAAAGNVENYVSRFQAATDIPALVFPHATLAYVHPAYIYDIHLIIGFRSFRLGPFSCISRAADLGIPAGEIDFPRASIHSDRFRVVRHYT